MNAARIIEAVLFGGRWLIVPVYIAMLGLLGIIVVYFIGELVHALPILTKFTQDDLIALTLSLIDLSLTANLIVLVILSGYENFVRQVEFHEDDPRPDWMRKIDFSGLKLKLLASMAVIAAAHLLRSLLNVTQEANRDLAWQLGIVLSFGVLALLLAVTDKVEHKED